MMHQSARKTLFPLTRQKRIGTLLMFAVRSIFAKPERVVAALREAATKGKIDKCARRERRAAWFPSARRRRRATSPRRPIDLRVTSRASTWCCSAPAMPGICAPTSRRCSSRHCPRPTGPKLATLFGHLTGVGMDAAPMQIEIVSSAFGVTAGRLRRIGLQYTGLRQRRADLLHAVDQFDRGHRGQHHALCRIPASGDRRVRLHVVEPGDAELDPQRLAVEIDVVDRIGERLGAVRPVDVADGRGLSRRGSAPTALLLSGSFAISLLSLWCAQRHRSGVLSQL